MVAAGLANLRPITTAVLRAEAEETVNDTIIE
jgi:hypothetical protein